ncbi:Transmembrane protein 198 [Phytophthora citrophthora]|uniref:Transmembrane protein 198 n=1 Tax=Phytophthora citrophthora TaxID=4793 RepID=A0AAD9GSN7_9STRA|nr:Transmembrane protein 198 [Phytophthora citrophthora]KAK1943864.1 Transmembrane protein 198 [Phytophthora citrophthora]KAK1943865.1 Transmembrane protein 198 [Phytophthora citrophthora]
MLVSAADSASDTVESLFDSTKGIKVGGSILAVAAIAVGAVMVVMGYRLFRATLFAVGFVAGGVAVAMVVENVFDDKSWVITASWIAFVVGGLICGCIVVSLYSLGIFIAGAAAGVALAMMLNNSVGYEIYPSHPQVVLIVLCIVLGLLCGVLAIKLEKPVLITATSLFGAAILVWGVGYFAGDFPSSNDLKEYASQDINGDWVYSIPDAWWGYLAGILVLFVLGLFIQFRKTGRDGAYHKSHAMGRREETVQYVETGTPQNIRYGNPVSHV